MSTVAYKNGVLAADTRAYGGSWQASPGAKAKIHLLENGSRVGITSATVGAPERLLAWLKAGGDPSTFGAGEPACSVLLIKRDGSVFLARDSLYFAGPLDCKHYAIGSGADFALGAMEMGASAEEAVRVACRLDPHTGEPVQALTI